MNAFKLLPRTAYLLCLPALILLAGCKDELVRKTTYRATISVLMNVAELRAMSTDSQAPQELGSPGKIYVYGNFLLINEINKGIHVVDNSNPKAPLFLNFIKIPGNVDMAVNNGILYTDSYVDLIVFNISDPTNIKAVKRLQDVFEARYANKAKGIVYTTRDATITSIQSGDLKRGAEPWVSNFSSTNSDSRGMTGGGYGAGGSTARFTLMNGFLYTVDNSTLKLFNISDPVNPQYKKNILLGGGIETIFPYDGKLFIGSTGGMHIYNAVDAANPVKLSTYSHITSCDPVVVQGKYAYVTLRSGNFCRQGTNLLEVLNIENPTNPVRVSIFPMMNPHGLAISGKTLYVCEGKYGFRSFDSSDSKMVGKKELAFLKNIDSRDVLEGPVSLIVTGRKGIYQFDKSNPSILNQLSFLPAEIDEL